MIDLAVIDRIEALIASAGTIERWNAKGELLTTLRDNALVLCSAARREQKLREALVRIYHLVAVSEPMGMFMTAQDIAREALKGNAMTLDLAALRALASQEIDHTDYVEMLLTSAPDLIAAAEQLAACRVELEAQKQRYLLLTAQHGRLCDQVYEEDGEALKQDTLREELESAKFGMFGSDYCAPEKSCFGCGKPLLIENAWMEDGCPCNTFAGVNNLNLYRWNLLHKLQQQQSRELEAERKAREQAIKVRNVVQEARVRENKAAEQRAETAEQQVRSEAMNTRNAEQHIAKLECRVEELTKHAEQYPELNMSNYNEDDIAALNKWGYEMYALAKQEKPHE